MEIYFTKIKKFHEISDTDKLCVTFVSFEFSGLTVLPKVN